MLSRGRGKQTTTKFYQQDIVQQIASPYSLGIVLRCWHDAEDISHLPPLEDPLMRPLQPGEVGVSFLTGGERQILSETDLRLIDRTLQPGDFCKRSVDEVWSGVITDVRVRGRVAHVISGEVLEGWKTVQDIDLRVDAEIGDYVVYDDWIGQVIELFDESLVEISNGQIVRLPDMSSRLNVGDKGTDILPSSSPTPSGHIRGTPQPGDLATVLSIKRIVYAIAWLAVSQMLDPSVAEKKSRPQRFWHGEDVGKLTLIRGRSDAEMRVGDRVFLKDSTGAPITTHGGNYGQKTTTVQMFLVTVTETTVGVLWADGKQEMLKSTDIIPYMNPDEYDCWPGDHVVWKIDGEERPAVVQSVNAKDRTASILFTDTGNVELTPLLELDPHGTTELTVVGPQSASESLGVRRGDFVFIHKSGTTNGFQKPFVPKIGELETWVREDLPPDGPCIGWRKEMADLGSQLVTSMESVEVKVRHPVRGSQSFPWLGEVTNLNLDGSVEVTHPDFTVATYPLERLTKLYDGIEQLEDGLWLDGHVHDDEPGGTETWSMDDDGVWRLDINNGEWEDVDDDIADPEDTPMDAEDGVWAVESVPKEMEQSSSDMSSPSVGTAPRSAGPETDESMALDEGWKRFEMLTSAPTDHAFINTSPAQPPKSFHARLAKEYHILDSSLPDSILVRTYQDRTDLLRSLIIGPANTPYEDAPFMIDWLLDSNFPHTPPIAHFHSWTNGNGRGKQNMVYRAACLCANVIIRVNPNLYEEGKVCLSILGTWAGDRNETWSAARSSLLQTFVSIQGLVLVKEPWFCEPAYEKLRGTQEGIINSRLYNEKAYVLSRGFVLRALEIPLGGLEPEVQWLYYRKGKLRKVLEDAQTLIQKSMVEPGEPTGVDQDLAVPRLTAGGMITLERTLTKLRTLVEDKAA